jgi:ankyrin repeat protein
LNSQNDDGNTALHVACLANSVEIVQMLLQSKADPLIQNKYGFYPVQDACGGCSLEVFKLLEETIPKIPKKDIIHGMNPVHFAARNPDLSVMLYLFEKKESVIYERDGKTGGLPIHYAVDCGNVEAVKWLVGKQININCKDVTNGNTPLHVAAMISNLELVQYLWAVGADPLIPNKDNLRPIDICIDVGGELREFFEAKNEYVDCFSDRSFGP